MDILLGILGIIVGVGFVAYIQEVVIPMMKK